MEDGQGAINIPMDLHFDSDVVTAVSIRRDLECQFLEADAIVGVNGPLELFAEDVIDITPYPRNEGGPFCEGRLFKLGVEAGYIDLGQVSIRSINGGNAVKG